MRDLVIFSFFLIFNNNNVVKKKSSYSRNIFVEMKLNLQTFPLLFLFITQWMDYCSSDKDWSIELFDLIPVNNLRELLCTIFFLIMNEKKKGMF